MQDKSSETKSAKRKIHHSARFWILIGLVVVVVLFFIMLPVGIEYGVKRYLKDQGADQVSLADVDFNPITGRMTLTNLSVIIGAQEVLKIPQATLKIEWRPFISKRFVLARIEISDTELTVQRFDDSSWQIGGIKLSEKKETLEPSTWNFGFQQATVKNSNIKFISPQLSSELKIEQAKISKLRSWLPERGARLEFKGQLNDGDLQLQMVVSPFGSELAVSGQIKLKDLTLTPFAQLLQPQINILQGRFDVDVTIETRQAADSGFSHRQKGLLKLSQIRSQIGDTEFSNESLSWDGAVNVEIPKSTKVLKISTDGKLNGSSLSMTAKNANVQIQQEHLNWGGKLDFEQTPAASNLDADGTLSLQNTGVNVPEVKLTEEKLNWKGTVQLSIAEIAGERRIIADGNLAGGPLTAHLVQENLNLMHAGFDWQGKFDYAREKAGTGINTDGQMQLLKIKMESPEANLTEEKLAWQGTLQFSTTAATGDQRVIADGTIDSNHLQADLPDRKLKLGHQGFSWKGRLDSGETNDFSSLKAKADFSLDDIEILQSETNQHLFNLDQASFQTIQIEGLDKIQVSGIALDGLALLSKLKSAQSTDADSSILRLQALEVKDIELSQQKDLAVESINMKAMKIYLRRDSEGKLSVIERLKAIQNDVSSADQSNRAAPDSSVKQESDKFGFRIGQVEITADSKLRFKDESVRPAFNIDLSLLEARLSNLDSRQPEKPAIVKLIILDEENARISLDGTMQLFAEQLSLDWKGNIEALELPPLSPYVIQSTGYRFTGGELHADIPLQINKNQLNGAIDLIMYNPEIKAESRPKAQKGKIRLNMTLDSALRLLRDKQNNVKLKIPISGNVNDPQFSVADAVNKVLAKTLQKSALSYLKYMLGPYGIGISVAEFAYGQATKIRLNPILFAPGSDELDEAAIDYLQRVAAIMKEYPASQVSVCGVATESDRKDMNKDTSTDALLELAKNRMDNIEDHLVKLNGIEAKRIIACEPRIDSNSAAKPRAELEI